MIPDIDELICKIDEYAKQSVTQARYEHSVRVAQMCERICRLWSIDPKLGYLSGISHDICKCLDDESMLSISKKDGLGFSELELKKPGLFHGRAAAVVLIEKFGIKEENLLDAVRYHTFGKKDFCDLGKILYVADKIEPGRKHITSEYIEDKLKMDLNLMTKTVLKENIDYLLEKGKLVAPESKEFYNSL